jgi:hypothetical protein
VLFGQYFLGLLIWSCLLLAMARPAVVRGEGLTTDVLLMLSTAMIRNVLIGHKWARWDTAAARRKLAKPERRQAQEMIHGWLAFTPTCAVQQCVRTILQTGLDLHEGAVVLEQGSHTDGEYRRGDSELVRALGRATLFTAEGGEAWAIPPGGVWGDEQEEGEEEGEEAERPSVPPPLSNDATGAEAEMMAAYISKPVVSPRADVVAEASLRHVATAVVSPFIPPRAPELASPRGIASPRAEVPRLQTLPPQPVRSIEPALTERRMQSQSLSLLTLAGLGTPRLVPLERCFAEIVLRGGLRSTVPGVMIALRLMLAAGMASLCPVVRYSTGCCGTAGHSAEGLYITITCALVVSGLSLVTHVPASIFEANVRVRDGGWGGQLLQLMPEVIMLRRLTAWGWLFWQVLMINVNFHTSYLQACVVSYGRLLYFMRELVAFTTQDSDLLEISRIRVRALPLYM